MEVKLKKLEVIDFKGVSRKEYEFGNKTIISGCNGSGKTTISDAFFWVLFDKNYALSSNPNIRPNDGRECTPMVTLELLVDGKPVTVSKMQKCKYSKPDEFGKRKMSLTNAYEINSVEKTERDFKSYLENLNIDFVKFLWLSHPDVFLSGMNSKKEREQMRNILFQMTESSCTDLDIARMSDMTTTVAEMLLNYKLEEIEAMQNATKRKITEVYGTDGKLLLARISGLESAKYRVDISDLELEKKHFEEALLENQKKQNDVSKQFEEMQKQADDVLRLKFKLGDIQRVSNADLDKKRSQLKSDEMDLINQIRTIDGKVRGLNLSIQSAKSDSEKYSSKLDEARELWKKINDSVFDESTTICSLCGQRLPEDDISNLKNQFDVNKKNELARISKSGTDYKAAAQECKNSLEKLNTELKESNEKKTELEVLLSAIRSEIAKLPESVDISNTEEYKAIVSRISEKEKSINYGNSASDMRKQLKYEESSIRSQLEEVNKKIFRASNNDEIDEQIAELRRKQKEYEQSLADCENILNQIKEIRKKKNQLLTEEINSHFDIVNWQFFDYQKNGEYKEVCIPTINEKRFGECTNTGLEVLAKLDIIKGLQRFYGQYYPVFLDNAECLDSKSKAEIEMDCQLIMMCVSEDKKLKVGETIMSGTFEIAREVVSKGDN